MRYFSKFELRFARSHQEKYAKFSGLCVLFNLKLSWFIVLLSQTAQLLYQVHLALSTTFLGYFKVFSELKLFFLSNFDIVSNFLFIVNSVFLLFFKKVCFCFSVF